MFYSKGLVRGPAPQCDQCAPSSICLAFVSEQFLNTLKSAVCSLTENVQIATGGGTRGGDLRR